MMITVLVLILFAVTTSILDVATPDGDVQVGPKKVTLIFVLMLIVTLVFVVEVSLRALALGWKRFTSDKFCLLDLVVTLVDIFSTAMEIYSFTQDSDSDIGGAGKSATILRVMRVLRFVRLVRVARLARFYKNVERARMIEEFTDARFTVEGMQQIMSILPTHTLTRSQQFMRSLVDLSNQLSFNRADSSFGLGANPWAVDEALDVSNMARNKFLAYMVDLLMYHDRRVFAKSLGLLAYHFNSFDPAIKGLAQVLVVDADEVELYPEKLAKVRESVRLLGECKHRLQAASFEGEDCFKMIDRLVDELQELLDPKKGAHRHGNEHMKCIQVILRELELQKLLISLISLSAKTLVRAYHHRVHTLTTKTGMRRKSKHGTSAFKSAPDVCTSCQAAIPRGVKFCKSCCERINGKPSENIGTDDVGSMSRKKAVASEPISFDRLNRNLGSEQLPPNPLSPDGTGPSDSDVGYSFRSHVSSSLGSITKGEEKKEEEEEEEEEEEKNEQYDDKHIVTQLTQMKIKCNALLSLFLQDNRINQRCLMHDPFFFDQALEQLRSNPGLYNMAEVLCDGICGNRSMCSDGTVAMSEDRVADICALVYTSLHNPAMLAQGVPTALLNVLKVAMVPCGIIKQEQINEGLARPLSGRQILLGLGTKDVNARQAADWVPLLVATGNGAMHKVQQQVIKLLRAPAFEQSAAFVGGLFSGDADEVICVIERCFAQRKRAEVNASLFRQPSENRDADGGKEAADSPSAPSPFQQPSGNAEDDEDEAKREQAMLRLRQVRQKRQPSGKTEDDEDEAKREQAMLRLRQVRQKRQTDLSSKSDNGDASGSAEGLHTDAPTVEPNYEEASMQMTPTVGAGEDGVNYEEAMQALRRSRQKRNPAGSAAAATAAATTTAAPAATAPTSRTRSQPQEWEGVVDEQVEIEIIDSEDEELQNSQQDLEAALSFGGFSDEPTSWAAGDLVCIKTGEFAVVSNPRGGRVQVVIDDTGETRSCLADELTLRLDESGETDGDDESCTTSTDAVKLADALILNRMLRRWRLQHPNVARTKSLFKGGSVRILKPGSQAGRTGVVTDLSSNGMVKIRMSDGAITSYSKQYVESYFGPESHEAKALNVSDWQQQQASNPQATHEIAFEAQVAESEQRIEFHAQLVELLACACMGRRPAEEEICKKLVPLRCY
jgi:hypothetical protein